MAFLNNLDKKLSEIGQGALKKTRDVSDTVKISGAIKDEESKQMEIFRQMGAYYYHTYSNQADGQMKAWCDAINASQALIKQYQEQLTILKGVAFCPNCNAEVPLTSAFCSNCGAKMVPQTSAAPVHSGRVCPGCGTPASEGQMFCTNCGTRIPAVSAAMPEPVVQEVRRCRSCGSELAEGQLYCTNCGSKYTEQPAYASEVSITPNIAEEPETGEGPEIKEEQETPGMPYVMADPVPNPVPEPMTEAVHTAANRCPNCGKELREGQMFCTNCGTKL